MPKSSSWLDVADVARLLQIPVVKVQRWVHQGKIPCKFTREGVRFRSEELSAWARSHELAMARPCSPEEGCMDEDTLLTQALTAGGVIFDLEGSDIYLVLDAVSRHLRFEFAMPPERILEELLAREELASTGIGRGVAIPHPRNMSAIKVSRPQVTLCYLRQAVDFAAVDGRPVDLLFAMFSPDSRTHLGLLSRLGCLLRREHFLSDLRGCRSEGEVMNVVRKAEKAIRLQADGPE